MQNKLRIWCLFAKAHWDENRPGSKESFELGIRYSLRRYDVTLRIYRDSTTFETDFDAAKAQDIEPNFILYDGDIENGVFGDENFDINEFLSRKKMGVSKISIIPRQLLMKSDLSMIDIFPVPKAGWWSRLTTSVNNWREAFSNFDH